MNNPELENTNPQQEMPDAIDEIGFDEPAESLFSPLELQGILRNAYAWLGRARADLFNAARSSEFCKRELLKKQMTLRMGEAFGLLKNEDLRKAYLAEQCADLVAACDAADDDLNQARMYFEQAGAEVEQARALLRIAELAASLPEDCGPFLPRKVKSA
jgi:hypothetical protein